MNVPAMQAVRLKGMATPELVAGAAGLSEAEAEAALAELAGAGDVQERNGRYRVTREGRDRLDAALATEREAIDGAALSAIYEDFTPLNSELKRLMHRWQLRDDAPNDHSDAAYDGAIVADLGGLHERFAPLVERAVAVTGRLAPYPGRFAGALERVQGGDHQWFARPLVDSYHTVWFEFHEELIGLAGLNREDEAAEGRAE